jgi:hypothetical protein
MLSPALTSSTRAFSAASRRAARVTDRVEPPVEPPLPRAGEVARTVAGMPERIIISPTEICTAFSMGTSALRTVRLEHSSSGVAPPEVTAKGSAPCSSSARMARTSLATVAKCSGVAPSASRGSTKSATLRAESNSDTAREPGGGTCGSWSSGNSYSAGTHSVPVSRTTWALPWNSSVGAPGAYSLVRASRKRPAPCSSAARIAVPRDAAQ